MLQKNLSAAMKVIRASRNQSITEFSEDLGIARSSLQDILNGTGNPRMDTVEYIASQLQVSPITLLSGSFEDEQLQTALLLIQTIDAVSKLTDSQRLEFAELFQKMILLLNSEPEKTSDNTPDKTTKDSSPE